MRHRTALLLAGLALSGCMTTPAPSPPNRDAEATVVDAPRAEPRVAPGADEPLGRSSNVTTSSEPALACRMTVSETEGCVQSDVEKWLEPAHQRIAECSGAKGGKVRVRLRMTGGKLGIDVEPNASLNPTERQCILDALATISADSAPITTGEPRTTGFTSLVTIEW